MVFLTFLTYKLSNLGEFEWEIFPNFGMSEKSEKIETFISENFRSSWFFLTILTFDFDLKKLKWKNFLKLGIYSWNFSNFLVISKNFWQILVKWENWENYKWECENRWVWSQFSHTDPPWIHVRSKVKLFHQRSLPKIDKKDAIMQNYRNLDSSIKV